MKIKTFMNANRQTIRIVAAVVQLGAVIGQAIIYKKQQEK